MSISQCRQNYHSDCEASINRQINIELQASYAYQSMSFYFDRDDAALPGFSKYFEIASSKVRERAEKLMKYQNQRGGRILLQAVKKPERDEWGSALEAMESALRLEKSVNQSVLEVHKVASQHEDAQLCHYLDDFLDEQVKTIKKVGDHVTQLKRVGPGLGEHIYDKNSIRSY